MSSWSCLSPPSGQPTLFLNWSGVMGACACGRLTANMWLLRKMGSWLPLLTTQVSGSLKFNLEIFLLASSIIDVSDSSPINLRPQLRPNSSWWNWSTVQSSSCAGSTASSARVKREQRPWTPTERPTMSSSWNFRMGLTPLKVRSRFTFFLWLVNGGCRQSLGALPPPQLI